MKILVQKFGGTSVDRPEHRALAARKVIQARDAGYSPVVVVSAIGRAGAPYATDTLIKFLKDVDPQTSPSERELDMMMACGEIISTAVFAQTLTAKGCKAIALSGGQAGIITDPKFGDARISEIRPQYILRLLEQGYIPVVCGFQGITEPAVDYEHGAITTLGRGGSDTTAAALGVALHAHAVEIFTDVDGIKTADPDLVPAALTLVSCSYEEVAEIAHQGAKVVHPRAAELAMDHDIPLWVKSTFSDAPGTCIAVRDSKASPRLTGITHTGRAVFIRLEIGDTVHKQQIEREVYRMMARAGVSIYFVTFSARTLSFVVDRKVYPIARDLLDGMVVPIPHDPAECGGKVGTFYIFKYSDGQDLAYSVQRPLLEPMEGSITVRDVPATAVENCTVISVIASGHRAQAGVMAKIFECLSCAGVPIYQTADTEMSISFLISETDVDRSVTLLHGLLFENNAVS